MYPDARILRPGGLATYLELSQRPLHVLVFLVPLIAAYEFGIWAQTNLAAGGDEVSLSAYRLLVDMLNLIGASGFHLPGLVLVVILLAWHVLARQPWRVHPGVPFVMALEAVVWMLPLVVADQVIARLGGSFGNATMMMQDLQVITDLPWHDRLLLSIGAGLYEELVFRMLLIAAAHALFVDVIGMSKRWGGILSIAVSAAAFAWFHDLSPGAATTIQLDLALFYLVAGVYFASLYVLRGFGIVVGAHAVYDIVAILLLPGLTS